MRAIRGRDISMIFQEPMTSLNPVLTIGLQIMEPLFIHKGMSEARGARPRRRALADGRHLRRAAAARPVSAPVLGRHAPAGDDRDRARVQSQADHRRRADHRARRHDPGADPAPDEGAVARARHRDGGDHPQPRHRRALRRPGERDVRGAPRRAGNGEKRVREAAASLHRRPAALGAETRPAARSEARDHRGSSAQPAGAARRLPLRAALPREGAGLRRDAARGRGDRAGTSLRLPARARARAARPAVHRPRLGRGDADRRRPSRCPRGRSWRCRDSRPGST